jgi:hypothetical protein
MVSSERDPSSGCQLANTLVVLHCGTETHWATSYPVSAPGAPATWRRVVPVVETRTTYRPAPHE